MAVGGSTCGAKFGGAKKNNRKYGGNAEAGAEPGAATAMPQGPMDDLHGPGHIQSVISGGKRPVKRVAKPVAKRVVKRVVRRVVRRGGNDGGNDGMPQIHDEMPRTDQTPHKLAENMGVGEMPTTEKLPMNGGRKKYAKRGGNADGMPKALGGAKKRVLTPYNKFVKKHFPAMKVKYPDYKAPQIMKKIADEWKKTK
jgi:hypothetical protein